MLKSWVAISLAAIGTIVMGVPAIQSSSCQATSPSFLLSLSTRHECARFVKFPG